jgi:alcohol dehydrogenase class IV
MKPFVTQHSTARVVFGAGASRELAAELERLGARRALFVCSERARADVQAVAAELGELAAGVFAGARQHVPISVADAAVAEAVRADADCVVCYGGGSAIGLGKAIALRRDVAIVAVPSTYSGSEMTAIWGMTGEDGKQTGRDERVRPSLVIYDSDLTLELPVATSLTSAFNAMAHSVEALYAPERNASTDEQAEASIRAIARSLPGLAADPRDREAREQALYGAYLAGAALGAVSMALHHKLCHVLGGSFGLPHSETHTVVLPHAVRYNQPAARDAIERVARALGTADAATGIYDLETRVGAPTDLRSLGLREHDLDRAAELASQNSCDNPRPVTVARVRALLDDAWRGRRPSP